MAGVYFSDKDLREVLTEADDIRRELEEGTEALEETLREAEQERLEELERQRSEDR